MEDFRKKSKNYLSSFDTIAGSGPNGAIIHYRSSKKTNRKIKKNDILLVDSVDNTSGELQMLQEQLARTVSKSLKITLQEF